MLIQLQTIGGEPAYLNPAAIETVGFAINYDDNSVIAHIRFMSGGGNSYYLGERLEDLDKADNLRRAADLFSALLEEGASQETKCDSNN